MIKYLRIVKFLILLAGICWISSCHAPGILTGKKVRKTDTTVIAYGKPLQNNDFHSDNIPSPSNPEILPAWIFDSGTTANGFEVCGISDPINDEEAATELARYRALAIAALISNSKVDNVTEAYYRDLSRSRLITTQFNSLSKISATIGLTPESVMVNDEVTTTGGEKIIQFFLNPSDIPATDSLFVEAEVYYSETPLSTGDRIYTYFKISAYKKAPGKDREEVFVWESHLDNGRLEFVSVFRGEVVDFPVRYRYYSSPKIHVCRSEPDPDHFMQEDMGYGLWNAYAITILRNIDLLEKKNVDIKAMTDNYAGQAELLSREISSNRSSFLIEPACTMNNRLYLRLRQL